MKKLLSLALSLALVFSVAAVAGVSASAEGETVILDWSKFNGYSGGGFDFTKDEPTGYVHVTATDKKISDSTQITDLLNWWGWTAAGYDKIQFTAYTASGSCNIRMVFDGVEHETKTISEARTVVTYDVPATTKTDDVKFQLDAGTKGATVSVDLYIGDVYGIIESSSGGEDTPTTPDIPKIEMLPGAALRIDGKTEGIRFDATVNTAELKDYTNSVSAIAEMGMLVAKEEYATLDNMILANAKESNEPNANIETNVVKAIYAEDVTLGTYNETHNSIIGSLVEIKEENTTKNYVARAFIKFGNGEVTYSPTLSDARSVAYVANEFMNDKSSDYAKLCDEHKSLISGWADKLNTETREIILDWSKFNGYSGGGFGFTKDEPTGYIHVTGDKTLNDKTSVAELLNWYNWTAAGYDKIQFTAYTATGSCNIRMVFDGVEHATKTISTEPTVVTYDVPATTKTGDVKFQLDAGTKGATVSVNLYIGDVYGIKTN